MDLRPRREVNMFDHLATWTPVRPDPEQFTIDLKVNGVTRKVFYDAYFVTDAYEGKRSKTIGLSHDIDGRFYAEEWIQENGKTIAHTLSVVRPDQGLTFLLSRLLKASAFTEFICEELKTAQPPVKPKRKRKEAAKQPLLG